MLNVDGQKVTYDKRDISVGLWPYNLGVTTDGKLVLTPDNGNSGRSDGHVDTVTVVDIEANPPRVIDKVVIGDAPEGFAVNPNGKMAVAILLGGSDGPKNSWFYNRNGSVVTLKIDGKKVTKTGEVRGRGRSRGRRVQSRRPLALRRQLTWTRTSRCCVWTVIRSSTRVCSLPCRAARRRCAGACSSRTVGAVGTPAPVRFRGHNANGPAPDPPRPPAYRDGRALCGFLQLGRA